MPDPTAYAPWLWLLSTLFLLRVLGQVLVVLFHPRWLPPMAQWYSGLMPYRYLLPAQLLILALMAAINVGFTRGGGVFATPHSSVGRWLVGLAGVYFTGMVVRYVIRMTRQPDQRWLGARPAPRGTEGAPSRDRSPARRLSRLDGTIPIVFHCVLAAYLFTVGHYHLG